MSKQVKEIYTKALLARNSKKELNTYTITTLHPCEQVLGCWITSHMHQGSINQAIGLIHGSFDVHVWYSYEKNKSEVSIHHFEYDSELEIAELSQLSLKEELECKSYVIEDIQCMKASIVQNNQISLDLSKHMGMNVIGYTMLKIELSDDDEIGSINQHFIA